ncbi:MAG: M48 family metallopeptidase, partial [Terriglobales bacterium]
MKRWLALGVVLLLTGGAIYIGERRKAEAPVSPGAVLTMAADVQRSASRVPAVATRISDAEEIQIGDSMAARAAMMGMGASQDPDAVVVEAYIQKIGSHVAARAQRKLPYRFHYVAEDGFDNAFALPGGHVFIGKGLLAIMDSEDQLAAVLGHEIEHIDRRHCVERVQLEARTRRLPLGVVGALAQIPIEIFQAGYTKNQELEADSEGTKLAVRAGYSYQGAVRLFEAMEKHSGKPTPAPERKSLRREIGKLAVQTVSGYFQSHPPKAERIRQIRQLAEREGWQARSEKPLPAAIAGRVKPKPSAKPACGAVELSPA